MGDNYSIFRKGSTTYFYSSLFFPKKIKEDVAILYSFVRIVDDLVDSRPPKKNSFYEYWDKYKLAWNSKCNVKVIDQMVSLAKRRNILPEWIDSFWESMEMDLVKPHHESLEETEKYMYGSAEVIGLMMIRILNLPDEAQDTAKKLGKAMQYANFIRDYKDDVAMGRGYLQTKSDEDFLASMPKLIDRYYQWQEEAEVGYRYLPKNYLVPIKTAAEMYKWTINRIAKDPNIVFLKKVKPSKLRIVATGIMMGLNL